MSEDKKEESQDSFAKNLMKVIFAIIAIAIAFPIFSAMMDVLDYLIGLLIPLGVLYAIYSALFTDK